MAYQILISYFTAIVGLCLEISPSIFMSFIAAMLDEFCEKLESLNNKLELIKCIQYQLRIFQIAQSLNGGTKILFYIRGISTIIIVCATIFSLVLNLEATIVGKLTAYLAFHCMKLFVACYYGSKVTEMSEKVSNSIVNSDWMYENKEYRQLVRIVLEFSKRPIKIFEMKFGNVQESL